MEFPENAKSPFPTTLMVGAELDLSLYMEISSKMKNNTAKRKKL